MSYPAMSAYEFDHFRREPDVYPRWEGSSIYMICQRPVLYFANVVPGRAEIACEIRQRNGSGGVRVSLPIISGSPYFGATDSIFTDIQFYDGDVRSSPPYDNVAGFKFFDKNNVFSGWLSPERFIYEWLIGKLKADVEGDVNGLLHYRVHYIGKAQDQPIWERLTGHESFQTVLSREFPLIAGDVPTFEIAILFFELNDVTAYPLGITDTGEIIGLDGRALTREEAERALNMDYISTYERAIVTDAEAFLINFMLPKYNRILFKSYPNIAGGLKTHGMTGEHLLVPFATLITEEATISGTLTPMVGDSRS